MSRARARPLTEPERRALRLAIDAAARRRIPAADLSPYAGERPAQGRCLIDRCLRVSDDPLDALALATDAYLRAGGGDPRRVGPRAKKLAQC